MAFRLELVSLATLLAACGRELPPLPAPGACAAPGQSAEAPAHSGASANWPGASAEGASRARRAPAAALAEVDAERSEPSIANGTCEVTVDVPEHLPVDLEVAILAAPSAAFLRTGDWRVMDEIETRSICRDSYDAELTQLPEGTVVTYRGERARITFPITGLPTDRRLWAFLSTLEDRSPSNGFPGEVLLGAFGPLERGGASSRVELRAEPAARVTGTVSGRRVAEWPGGDEECESWSDEQWEAWERWEAAQEPRNRSEFDLDVERIDARLAGDDQGETTGTNTYDAQRFLLAPVPSGPQRIDVLATTAGGATVHRSEQRLTARRGRVTDLGEWVLQIGRGPLALRCESDTGAPLQGSFVLEFERYAPVSVGGRGEGPAHVYGEWSDCRLVRFVPADSLHFAPTEKRLTDGLVEDVSLVCRRRAFETSAVFLDGDLPNGDKLLGATCAWLRAPGEERWHAATLESLHAFCVRNWSSPTRTGRVEALLWQPESGVCYRGPLTIPPAGVEEESVRVSLEDPRTRVHGELRFRLAGEVVFDTLELRVQPPGLVDDGFPRAWADLAVQCVEPGPFELRGLPPGVPFDLDFLDGRDRVVRTLRVQLAWGQTLDLGRLEFHIDHQARPGR